MSKTTQTECSRVDIPTMGGGPCDGGRHVGTTDVSQICQKQHRQNEPAGQVDIPTRVEVCVTG